MKMKGMLRIVLALFMALSIFLSPFPASPAVAAPTWSPMSSGTSQLLQGVWGSSSTDIFAVGYGGTIHHYNGSSWSDMTSPTSKWLLGVWGNSSDDVFAVGDYGTIVHYDGNSWGDMTSNTTNTLTDVWGSSGSDVFAVGIYGTILHCTDGTSWSNMPSGEEDLSGVWGSASDDVFAVGDYGTILHYDGNNWSSMDSGTTLHLSGVWGSSPTDVFAVGQSGIILHYDGSSWSSTTGPAWALANVWGTSATDVFAVGSPGAILRYNGTSWTSMTSGTTQVLYGVWGSPLTDVFAVGDGGTILRYNGTSWSSMDSSTTQDLYGVWGSSGTDVFAVGWTGTILHYNGTSWGLMDSGTMQDLHDVRGNSGFDVFAVGYGGTILHYGGSWSSMTSGTTETLNGVWGNSWNDVFAVGASGNITHYDGNGWSGMDSGTGNDLEAVWGNSWNDVFAVGSSGTILHYDGSWSSMTSNTTEALYGVWGNSGTDVFAVGWNGTILHYNGSWSSMDSGTTEPLVGVWGSSSTDVFAVGTSGTILHYNGTSWDSMTSGTTETLYSVWGSSGTDVFAVGWNGTIRYACTEITASPTSIDFGSVGVGASSSAQTVNVTNDGNLDLDISTASITGGASADFSKQNDYCSGSTLTPGSFMTLQVVFSPTAGGTRSSTLQVPSNDPDEATVNVPLSGTGVVSIPPHPPQSPSCEGVTNHPAGVTDPTPEFSWTFYDPDAGDTQGAYQILVASTSANLTAGTGDMWNSGNVSSDASEVSYNGTTPAASTIYYWKVKTWDNYNAEGDYCDEQEFTTGTSQSEVWVDDDWAGSYHGKTVDSRTFNTDAFATIRDAIEVVSSNSTVPGTVNVAAGTYKEQVFINKAYLTVQATASANTTIIDGTDVTNDSPTAQAALVWLQQNEITFKGFTLQNYPSGWADGAVIWVQGWDGTTLVDGISNCQVSENKIEGSPSDIHGIHVSGGAVSANVTQNEIVSSGGDGILVTTTATCSAPSITNNTITGATNYGICLRPDSGTILRAFQGVTISGNAISGGEHGIGIFYANGSYMYITIKDNNITGVLTGEGVGIQLNDSTYVHVLGNTLEGNGTGIQVIDYEAAEACYARDNNISGSTSYGVALAICTDNFSATYNWWGDGSGPYATTNPTGTGDNVTDSVDYSPWLGAGVADSKSQSTSSGNVTVDATTETDTGVLKTGTGTPTITVTKYTGNPGGSAPGGFTSVGKYIDVHADNTTGVEEIEIRNYYTLGEIAGLTEATLKLSWWNDTAWVECSNSGATYPDGEPTYRGYVWAKITDNTTPTLEDLTGTPFMAMGSPSPPAPTGGGGGGGSVKYYLHTNVLGTKQSVMHNYAGKALESGNVTSPDSVLTINIPKGTITKDKNGNRLSILNVSVNENPPPPSQGANIIGLAYDFEPAGATFDPPITAILKYNHADIPEGVAEEDLVLAYYDQDAGEWVECECTCDPETNCVTACVCHFTCFAIIGQQVPVSPTAFSVSNLSVQPAEVQPKETVTITISVANTGGTEGTYTVVLKIKGVKEAEKSVTVAAGESQLVSFSVSKEDAGTYSVVVDRLSGSFVVVAPPALPAPSPTPAAPPVKPPINWPMLGGIIAAAVVVGLLIFFFVRRRYA